MSQEKTNKQNAMYALFPPKRVHQRSKRGRLTTKIFLFIGIPVGIAFLVTSFLVITNTRSEVEHLTNEQLASNAEAVSFQIDELFQLYIKQAETLGRSAHVAQMLEETSSGMQLANHVMMEGTLTTMRRMVKDNTGVLAFFVADEDTMQAVMADGTIIDGLDINTRPWYQGVKARSGFYMTDPYTDINTNSQVVTIAAPIYARDSSNIIGAVGIDITLQSVNEIMNSYRMGETGSFILASEQGRVIYHRNSDYIDKSIGETEMDDGLQNALSNKKIGPIQFVEEGIHHHGYVASVKSVGWVVAGSLPESEFDKPSNDIMVSMLSYFGLAFVVIIGLIIFVSQMIVSPLKKLRGAATQIASGDLQVVMDVKSNDEIGEVADAMGQTVVQLSHYTDYINEITEVLETMAQGDFRIHLRQEYTGKFSSIKSALMDIRNAMNATISMIATSASQVNQSAVHVSSSSQGLATGASEQAATIQQLSASIAEISKDINDNARNVHTAASHVKDTATSVSQSNNYMVQLRNAMNDIDEKSKQITSITRLIEDIAFQTNILALNAAIEAARAGSAGKGFAVVADEVRALAGKSSEAASQTSELIKLSSQAVEQGSELTLQTASVLDDISRKSQQLSEIIMLLDQSSIAQANAIQEITTGLDQVSNVVQGNAASAEQSSAASEELSAQASLLDNEVRKFKVDHS